MASSVAKRTLPKMMREYKGIRVSQIQSLIQPTLFFNDSCFSFASHGAQFH